MTDSLENVNVSGSASNVRIASGLIGLAVGLAGGCFIAAALQQPLAHLLPLGGLFGISFGLLLGADARGPGACLIWGEGAAFLLWLLLPARVTPLFSNGATPANTMLVATRQQLPELVSYLVCLGVPLGLSLGLYGAKRAARERQLFRWTQPLIAGGLAGLCGGSVFAIWTLRGGFSPILAGIAGSSSRIENSLLELGMSILFGALFGVLFQRDVRSLGSCMGWGLGFALIGWSLGPLTLFPLLRGFPLDWSPASVSNQFGALIGQILFGLLVGVSYAFFDRLWSLLFIQSDPLYRRVEGPALHIIRSLLWGAAAGFLGGVVSAPLMFATGVVSFILGANIHLSLFSIVVTHLTVSSLVGMGFGVIFRSERPGLSLGVAWGSLFGLIWWYVGVLTLLPLLLIGSVDWRPRTATMLLPSLIGHLLYGSVSAFIFLLFEEQFSERQRSQLQPPGEAPRDASPAPALCFFAIGLGVLLPMLLT